MRKNVSLSKKICYRVASHQLSHGSQTIPHCAVCQAPERDVEPRLKKLNKICKSRHITWSKGNSEGCPRKIWKPPSSEKTEPSLTLQNNNYCNNIESGITIKQNTKKNESHLLKFLSSTTLSPWSSPGVASCPTRLLIIYFAVGTPSWRR